MIYELSLRAQSNIEEIIRYTDKHFGPAQTDEYIGGLYYSFDLLTDNPRLGRVWKGQKRCYTYRMHNVYYRIKKTVFLSLRYDTPANNSHK